MELTYQEIIAVERFLTGREPNDWAKGRIKGRIEGYAWGKSDTMRDVILSFLSIRFSPFLADEAKSVVMPTRSYEELNMIFRQLITAPNRQTVRQVLDLPDERPQHGSSDLSTE